MWLSGSSTDVRQAAYQSPERNGNRKPQYIKHITKDLIREILVPEDQGQKSLVIDGETYSRLLKACNYKSPEQIEYEKQRANEDQDKLVVSFVKFLTFLGWSLIIIKYGVL